MNFATETKILTARPSHRIIGFALAGTLFLGGFAYLLLPPSNWPVADKTSYQTPMVIMWIYFGSLIFLASLACYCFCRLLSLKAISLTNRNLIIKRPLLLLNMTIPLNNIESIVEADYRIKRKYKGYKYNFSGHQTIITLKNAKTLNFNSFEISEYLVLTNKLKELLKITDS